MENSVLKQNGQEKKDQNLNPNAKEWDIARDRGSEEQRCLFLTFSKASPVYEHEIFRFFNEKYGPCVERVHVNRKNGENPMFGKVVFCYSVVPADVLKDDDQAKFLVNSKPMWCKKYQPKPREGTSMPQRKKD